MKKNCFTLQSRIMIILLLVVSSVLAKTGNSIPWYSPMVDNTTKDFMRRYGEKLLFDLKEVEGQGICLQNTTGQGQFCQKAHKLGESVQIQQGNLLFKTLNESFGRVNYNYINSKQYCDRKKIIVIQEEEHLSNIYDQSFEISMELGTYGQIQESASQVTSKAIINQEIDYIYVNMDQLEKIQKYLNDRVFDFWDNRTRFESSQDYPRVLRINESCDVIKKKIPPLDLTFHIYPADNYFQDEDTQVVQRKKVRIHSRHLLQQHEEFCYFGIAAHDLNDTIVIGQPLLRGHNVIFVHDLPPLAIIQPKKGEKFQDKDDGGDFVPGVNPYNRPADYPNNKKQPHETKIYDSIVDQMLSQVGLETTFVGQAWHWINKNNKGQIVLIITGAIGAFIIAGTMSVSFLAIVLEIIAYVYSQHLNQ